MLSNAYFLAKFRFDTAENEPAKYLQNFRKMHFRKMHFSKNALCSRAGYSKSEMVKAAPTRDAVLEEIAQLEKKVAWVANKRFEISKFKFKFPRLQLCKFLAGSFSAVSKRNLARKYAFDSIFQALQDLHPFAPLRSQNFRKKSV